MRTRMDKIDNIFLSLPPSLKKSLSNAEIDTVLELFHPDLFSTFLSRKHSAHRRIGRRMWTKTLKEQK